VYIDDLALTDGRYQIRELEPAPGYMPDTSVKTFWVRYGATSEIEWENTPMQGQIQITKRSEDYNTFNGFAAGTLLEGVPFEIYDRSGNLTDTVKTDKNGVAKSRLLPLGRYTVKEVQSVSFYMTNTDAVEAEIEFAGQIVRLEFLNGSIRTGVTIKKRGYAEVVPNQTVRYEISETGNTGTQNLDSFYWRDVLPIDAVRLSKIVTGTYSSKQNYKIVYRTNLRNDYITMADNLSTFKNAVIDASPTALGLAAGEYVTEFMLAFGVVPQGFAQLEPAYVHCDVLPWLPHEYRFTNKADAGGLHEGRWIMTTDRWTTAVYGKKGVPTLPRTGY
jgi:hypothetical protein